MSESTALYAESENHWIIPELLSGPAPEPSYQEDRAVRRFLPVLVSAGLHWRTVWWISLPALALIPLGAWLLVSLPAEAMRRGIALLVLTLVAILWSGWRYTGPRGAPVSATVGALGGFLSGSTGIGGPPAIIYLMSSGDGPALIRANLIGYFTVIGAGLIVYYSYQGLIGADVLWRAGLLIPFFVVGIVAGSRLFGLASAQTFRHIAFSILTASSLWVLLA